MSVSAALSFAQTVMAYFSPTKSPYYAVIAFGVTSLTLSASMEFNWAIIFFPIILLLIYCTYLSLYDMPCFNDQEYDDQIKFSRAFSLSAAVVCLVSTGRAIEPELDAVGNGWNFWLSYFVCMVQIIIFSLYAYVYANRQTKPINRNFVQLALITSTFLIGMVYANSSFYNESGGELKFQWLYTTISLFLFWLWTIGVWLKHLKKSVVFKVIVPVDAANIS